MNETNPYTPGIEVSEQPLNKQELGFLTGVFEAWANRTMTEADFRGAMQMLLDRGRDLDS
jgi:hypothetical protein